MRFSLIVPTLGRVDPLARLLASLDVQTYREFDVAVVDQNPDDRLGPVVAPYADRLSIRRLTSDRGASRARNAGLLHSTGDVVAFPDDDCWYPPDLLECVARRLTADPGLGGVTGRPAGDSYWDSTPGPINRLNVWKRGIEFTLFLRRGLVDQVGLLDEALGPGSGTPFWAAEGSDYLLRAIEAGHRLAYDPALEVFHPSSLTGPLDFSDHVRKSYHYALAKGHVLRRRSPAWFMAYQWLRPAAGACRAIFRKDVPRARVYWTVARGLVRGAFS